MEIRVVVALDARAEALLERLVAALGRAARAMVAPEGSDDRQPGVPPHPVQAGPLLASAAEQGRGVEPAEVPLPSPAPPVVARTRRSDFGERRAAWKTPEREAQMRADWGVPLAPAERMGRLAALPGPPIPEGRRNIQFWAEQLGLGPIAKAPAGERFAQANATRLATSWRTAARREILAREWPGYMAKHEIRVLLDAVDTDRPVPAKADLSIWAWEMGLKRPEGFRSGKPRLVALPAEAAVAPEPVVPAAVELGADAANDDANETQPAGSGEPASLPAPPPVAAAERGPGVAPVVRDPAPPVPAEARPVPMVAPRLPLPSNGRVYASFRQIKAWAAQFGIAYNGANIEAVNNRRKLMKLPPVVQDEDLTAADTKAA